MATPSADNTNTNSSPDIRTYLALRYNLGFLALVLSIILYFGNWWLFDNTTLENSISKYYHTRMRDAFVGFLVAIGIFLWSYNGYEKENELISDNVAGKISGFFAITTAVFPTLANGIHVTSLTTYIHFISAFILYSIIGYFCVVLFQKGNKDEYKIKRNKIYALCGWIIWGCVALIALFSLTGIQEGWWDSATFWLETIANLAFGAAWFIKGGAFSHRLNPLEWEKKADWEKNFIIWFERAFVVVLAILYPVMIIHVIFF